MNSIDNIIREYVNIGIALSIEKDLPKLLEMIVDGARKLSNADGGSLYIINENSKHLSFNILQNDSMNTRLGGTSGHEIKLPDVPMYIDDKPNYANVCSYVALTGKTVNIEDVYHAEEFDFTGPRKYDASTGYTSKSMCVVPLKNHENKIIGVLQLLNAQDENTSETTFFSESSVEFIASLGSQAAVAMTNVQLVEDLKELFYSFIQSIATAIDEKSISTGGHIKRVADITMIIADEINKAKDGPFEHASFNDEELEELRMAAWMHDVGKITTPEYIVDKSNKLETIYDRVFAIGARFQIIEKIIENDFLLTKIELLESGKEISEEISILEKEKNKKIEKLHDDYQFIESCNNTGDFMPDDAVDRMMRIGRKTFSLNGKTEKYLNEDELRNLTIRKGTLLDEERKIIENHATMTLKILEQLPFPDNLANVPEYAGGHHEKMDGSGYPKGLSEDDLPLQSRIMAIADIFEALTAPDRPYRKPIKLSKAIQILGFMKKDGHIDSNVLELFIEKKLYKNYAEKVLSPEQNDME